MLVFIRLLPESVTQNDLRKFVNKALRSPWLGLFGSQGKSKSTEIRKITYRQTLSVEYHGIVEIEPAKAAAAVIRKLNRSPLKGRDVEVRKYYQRSPLRDHRTQQGEAAAFRAENNRRRHDRRRVDMITERVHTAGALQSGHSVPVHTHTELFTS